MYFLLHSSYPMSLSFFIFIIVFTPTCQMGVICWASAETIGPENPLFGPYPIQIQPSRFDSHFEIETFFLSQLSLSLSRQSITVGRLFNLTPTVRSPPDRSDGSRFTAKSYGPTKERRPDDLSGGLRRAREGERRRPGYGPGRGSPRRH